MVEEKNLEEASGDFEEENESKKGFCGCFCLPIIWFKMLATEMHWSFVFGVVVVYGISQGFRRCSLLKHRFMEELLPSLGLSSRFGAFLQMFSLFLGIADGLISFLLVYDTSYNFLLLQVIREFYAI
jgi:hypothetical protein